LILKDSVKHGGSLHLSKSVESEGFFFLEMFRIDANVNDKEYLKKCIVTENHPAILIDWQLEVDDPFADGAYQNVVLHYHQPRKNEGFISHE
jgi:hypothetical protein